MTDLESFIKKFGGYSDSYWFYDHTVEVVYDKVNHVYLLVDGSNLIEQPSVTTIVKKALDKSEILIPWGCKRMGEKLMSLVPSFPFTLDSEEELEKLILISKRAHRETLEEAGTVGTAAHNWIEQHILEELHGTIGGVRPPEDSRAYNACIAAVAWMERHNVRWVTTERKIYSRIHKYAGTLDGLAYTDSCLDKNCCPLEYKDHLSLVDWKTSNNLYLDYVFQVAAYWGAFREEMEQTPDDAWIIRLGKDDAEFDPWHIPDTQELEAYYYGFLNARRWFSSVESAKEIVMGKKEELREARKAERAVAKLEKAKKACAYAKNYKAIRKPKCGCESCISRWNDLHPLDKVS